MNFIQLRYFIKTAEKLNYTRAADELFIARQSLRQTLTGLEEEIGKPLFLNTRNKLALTEYGSYLYETGKDVLAAFDKLQYGLKTLAAGSAKLRIGFSESLFPFILPDNEIILNAFRTQFPDVQLEIVKKENDRIIRLAENGEIDAGCILHIPYSHKDCSMFPLAEYEVALDYAQQSPFGTARYMQPEQLSGIPCQGMGSREITMQPFWNYCLEHRIDFPYETVPSTLDAFYRIRHGLAVGFDILKTNVPDFSWERTSVLSGFKWELGFLCSDQSPDQTLLNLFCQFMKREYSARWEKYNRDFPM